MRPHQRLQLGDHRHVAPAAQRGVAALLDRLQPELGQAHGIGGGEVVVGELGQGIAAPQAEGPGQQLEGLAGVPPGDGPAGAVTQVVEAREVDPLGPDPQGVAAGMRLEVVGRAGRAEDPADARDDGLQGVARLPRRLAPEGVDQAVARDHLAVPQEQDRQQRALAGARDLERTSVRPQLERPEDPVLDRHAARC